MKTLQQQQAGAWRLAPDDAEWIAQDVNTFEWYGYTDSPSDGIGGRFDCPGKVICKGQPISQNWRDTLQSRSGFEEMKPSELDKANGDHKEGFVPEVGQECNVVGEVSGENIVPNFVFAAQELGLIFGKNASGEGVSVTENSVRLEPIQTEEEKRRDEQIEIMIGDIESISPLTGMDSRLLAAALHQYGYRMTRDLTPEVLSKFWIDFKHPQDFAKAIAVYVTGSGEYE